ncbi:MAG: ABC transporter ATP-binding protein [Oscillospiraceae bacterium]|nr:ABC transporter ATP-binding protein [Oscillospiraceae bacterium]
MIEIRNLTKRYGEKLALDDISFTVEIGQVVGLLGLNGAGKSTTMNILTGYISASSGAVLVGGFDITSEGGKAKRMIGYLPEQPAFYPEMRVDEHLSFICGLRGVYKDKKERAAQIDDICAKVGISDVQRRMVRNLSKGYRQRVGFAAALIGQPKVIILDEPTAGLDPSQIIDMRGMIKSRGKQSTVIVSSHILSEIQTVCDRVIVINEGRLIADDTPQRLIEGAAGGLRLRIKGEPEQVRLTLRTVQGVERVERLGTGEPGAHDFVVFSREDCDVREAVFYALAQANMPLLSTGNAGSSLEDVFLRLTRGGGASV